MSQAPEQSGQGVHPMPEDLSEVTARTLHDTIMGTWEAHQDPNGAGQHALDRGIGRLVLYTGKTPSDRVVIIPLHHKSEDSTQPVRVIRQKGLRTESIWDIIECGNGEVSAHAVGVKKSTEGHPTPRIGASAIGEMQHDIKNGTTVKPKGRVAKAVGKLSINPLKHKL